MSLSVFVLLLAFFIVMNAISKVQQHKSGPALRSIEKTFALETIVPPSPFPEGGGDDSAADSQKEDVFGVLDALFRAELPGIKAERDDTRGVMHVRMTREAFLLALEQARTVSLPKESVYQWKEGSFVATLVGLVALKEKGVSLRMDVLLNLTLEPSLLREKDPEALNAAMKDAGWIAQTLQKSGLSAESLSVGLKTGQMRTVDLYFRKVQAFSPVAGDKKEEKPPAVGAEGAVGKDVPAKKEPPVGRGRP